MALFMASINAMIIVLHIPWIAQQQVSPVWRLK